MLRYKDFPGEVNCCDCRPCPPSPCPPRPCPPNPCQCCYGPCGPAEPFLSSYIEAAGSTQTVANEAHIVFDTDEGALDVAGNDIEIDATGTVFTIKRTGLYHVEWSLDIKSGIPPVLIGLMENGNPASALSNTNTTGHHSSGALINVSSVPLTLSLHNFGGQITLEDPVGFGNTVASIRILRFADGHIPRP